MNVIVNMPQLDGTTKSYEVSETALQIVVAWAGSMTETARLMGKQPSVISAAFAKQPCMREMIGNRYLLTQHLAVEGVQGAIADAVQVQQMWTRMMYDPNANDAAKLAASVNLAKSLGMFIERREVEVKHEESRHRSIAERAQLLDDVLEVPEWAR